MQTIAKNKSLYILWLLLLSMVSACAPVAPGAAPAGDAAPASSKIELRFSVIARAEEEMQAIQERIDGFMLGHPEIAVTTEPIPFDQHYEKLLTQIAGGTAPDVAEVSSDHVAELTQMEAIQQIEEETYGVHWLTSCGLQLVLPKPDTNRDQAIELVKFLTQEPCVVTWRPYPSPPSPEIIGDAELVPGAPEMVNAIAALEDMLKENGVQINLARTVRLADEGSDNFTYSAPLDPDVPAIQDKESFEKSLAEGGLITGVMVVPEKNEFAVPAGPYAERMYLEGDTKWVELVAPDGESYYQTEALPEDAGEHLAEDGYPTAAIYHGTKNCWKCYWWGCCKHKCP